MLKRFLATVACVCVFSTPAAADFKNVVCPTDSTTCAVQSGTSKPLRLYDVLLALNPEGAESLTVRCGSSQERQIGPIYFNGAGGVMYQFPINFAFRSAGFACDPGETLNVLKTNASTPVTVMIHFDQ